jgi:D-alanyl-D-alanine dipeptidase
MKQRISLLSFVLAIAAAAALAQDFVSIADVDPTIVIEARYATSHNFIGRPVEGYHAQKCMLTKEAAAALAQVQSDIRPFGYSLKVYDCYRPQRGVNDFMAWAKDVDDQKMKKEFYPRVDKRESFKLGYVAEKSGHSRGSTIDLTMIPLPVVATRPYREGERLVDCTAPARKRFPDNSLDMGTGYDCFDPLAATANPALTPEQRKNRLLLKSAMEKRGFKNYEKEWWHFTLANEPFPQTYFDVEIR